MSIPSNQGQAGRERRIFPRLGLQVEVSVNSEHNFYTGFTENISEGGVFIATYNYLPIGTRFKFSFTLPDSEQPIEAIGEVRWVREYSGEDDAGVSPGMGVRFVQIDEADLGRIKRFLQQRDPLFYDE